ncbi:MAG: serine/threonine protein kinase [Planctomyces sp.]|nr:serine/threonine protein kinase [Planctomyces sp.]
MGNRGKGSKKRVTSGRKSGISDIHDVSQGFFERRTMNPQHVCPVCTKSIPKHAPGGLCPACLLERGLSQSVEAVELPGIPDADQIVEGVAGVGNAAFAVTTPQPRDIRMPAVADLSTYFPQLEILELVGHGGMGAVYKARQKKLDRLVAVKIIRPEVSGDPAFAERFMREARTLARLQHPNIVAVHDFGEIELPGSTGSSSGGSMYYFIMEYIDGANLRQLIRTKGLNPSLTMSIMDQVCEALQYAHDAGVVHRDIKPENLLLDSRGRIRIADFGLAKLADGSVDNFTLTGTHQVMGTPSYMAPEQLTGSRDVDHRADIYSLGVVLYEMLTGSIPLGRFAPASHKAGTDLRLDDVINHALATEPDQRYQSISVLRNQVASIAHAPAAVLPESVTNYAESSVQGLSTILDREVAGVWRMVGGATAAASSTRPRFPALMALVLVLIGLVSTFFPWYSVRRVVNGENAASEIPETSKYMAQSDSTPLRFEGGSSEFPSATGLRRSSEYVLCQAGAPGAYQGFTRNSHADSVIFNESTSMSPGIRNEVDVRGSDLTTGRIYFMFLLITGILAGLGLTNGHQSILITGGIFLTAFTGLLAVAASISEVQNSGDRFAVIHTAEHRSRYDRVYLAVQEASGASQERISVSQGMLISEWTLLLTVPGAMAFALCILGLTGLRQAVVYDQSPVGGSVQGGNTVSVSVGQITELPEICVVCGCAGSHHVHRKLNYQPPWAQALTIAGFIFGGLPGVFIAMMTSVERAVALPVCDRHRNHGRRLILFASLAWMLIPVYVLLFTLVSVEIFDTGSSRTALLPIGIISGIILGVGSYVVPIVYMVMNGVKCEQTTAESITLSRVATPFARAVRQKSGTHRP